MELGCIADDITGATDLATGLVSRGYRTAVHFGVPRPGALGADIDAVVVALKTRTAPVAEAVDQSRLAADALRQAGASQLYFKYCSTFDSTPRGNIGPVIDELLQSSGVATTVVVPSFPRGGRTVYQGHLFVNGRLLDESPMRNHPLTPMRDSSVVRLLRPQTKREVRAVPWEVVQSGADAIRFRLADAADRGEVLVVDAIDDDDLTTIAEAVADWPLVTGGSGLGGAMTPRAAAIDGREREIEAVPGYRTILAGSLSEATRTQIEWARARVPHTTLDLDELASGRTAYVDRLSQWAADHWAREPQIPVMVYSPDPRVGAPVRDRPDAGELIERGLGSLAVEFTRLGATQLIVAGGETSGRVIQSLGVDSIRIGPEISPGVVWASASGREGAVNLALKSGNFGSLTMFTDAWDLLETGSAEG